MEKENEKTNIPHFEENTAWLLQAKTPSIRYLALTKLLGKPDSDPEAAAAKRLIMREGPVKDILDEQHADGFWIYSKHHYTPKYRSSHWSMLLLNELAAEPQHPKMQAGAAFMLEKMEKDIPDYRSEEEIGFGCFWGNWLRYELYCGKLEDERVQGIIEYTCADIERRGKCEYNYELPCSWGVIRDLYGLALIPKEKRSAQINEAIQKGIRFLLEEHNLLAADYPYKHKIHPLWSKLSFPLFYQADILFVLRVLKELSAADHPSAQKAREWLLEKQTILGKWRGGSPYRRKTWRFVIPSDTANHWLTLHALRALS